MCSDGIYTIKIFKKHVTCPTFIQALYSEQKKAENLSLHKKEILKSIVFQQINTKQESFDNYKNNQMSMKVENIFK